MDARAEGNSSSAIYQMKAQEMRRQAEQLHDPSARHQLVMLALAYELLAEHLLAGVGTTDDYSKNPEDQSEN